MDIKEYLTDLAIYNQWANTEIVNWLKAQSEKLLDYKISSSFESINKTVWHMLNAQSFWYSVSAKHEFTPTPDDILNNLILDSTKLMVFISESSLEVLEQERNVDLKTMKGTFKVYDILFNVINHNCYHRGQIVTAAHQLGFSGAPKQDYLFYRTILD